MDNPHELVRTKSRGAKRTPLGNGSGSGSRLGSVVVDSPAEDLDRNALREGSRENCFLDGGRESPICFATPFSGRLVDPIDRVPLRE